MRMDIVKQLVLLVLPTAVFYLCYSYIGILPAIAFSAVIAISSMVLHWLKHKKLSNTRMLSLLGLVLSFVAVFFTNNENLYYVPALVNNGIVACFAAILTARKKSVFHYVTGDLNIKLLNNVAESEFIKLNYMWIAFFVLKIASKLIGILLLDFKVLYWIVFVLGDPMTIVVVLLSVLFIKKKTSPGENNETSL